MAITLAIATGSFHLDICKVHGVEMPLSLFTPAECRFQLHEMFGVLNVLCSKSDFKTATGTVTVIKHDVDQL